MVLPFCICATIATNNKDNFIATKRETHQKHTTPQTPLRLPPVLDITRLRCINCNCNFHKATGLRNHECCPNTPHYQNQETANKEEPGTTTKMATWPAQKPPLRTWTTGASTSDPRSKAMASWNSQYMQNQKTTVPQITNAKYQQPWLPRKPTETLTHPSSTKTNPCPTGTRQKLLGEKAAEATAVIAESPHQH